MPDGCEVHELSPPTSDVLRSLEELVEALDAAGAKPALQPGLVPPRPEGPLTAEKVCQAIGAILPEGAILSDEAITSAAALPASTAGAPRHDWLTLTGGAIGQGLPVAVGAAIACPDRPVIALEADGSALYTIQSLWTMAREQLDVTVVIFNNRGYGILDAELARLDGHSAGPKSQGAARPGGSGPRFRQARQRARRRVAARRHRRAAHRRPRRGPRRSRPASDRGGPPRRLEAPIDAGYRLTSSWRSRRAAVSWDLARLPETSDLETAAPSAAGGAMSAGTPPPRTACESTSPARDAIRANGGHMTQLVAEQVLIVLHASREPECPERPSSVGEEVSDTPSDEESDKVVVKRPPRLVACRHGVFDQAHHVVDDDRHHREWSTVFDRERRRLSPRSVRQPRGRCSTGPATPARPKSSIGGATPPRRRRRRSAGHSPLRTGCQRSQLFGGWFSRLGGGVRAGSPHGPEGGAAPPRQNRVMGRTPTERRLKYSSRARPADVPDRTTYARGVRRRSAINAARRRGRRTAAAKSLASGRGRVTAPPSGRRTCSREPRAPVPNPGICLPVRGPAPAVAAARRCR